jgi:hypothetical protein
MDPIFSGIGTGKFSLNGIGMGKFSFNSIGMEM